MHDGWICPVLGCACLSPSPDGLVVLRETTAGCWRGNERPQKRECRNKAGERKMMKTDEREEERGPSGANVQTLEVTFVGAHVDASGGWLPAGKSPVARSASIHCAHVYCTVQVGAQIFNAKGDSPKQPWNLSAPDRSRRWLSAIGSGQHEQEVEIPRKD